MKAHQHLQLKNVALEHIALLDLVVVVIVTLENILQLELVLVLAVQTNHQIHTIHQTLLAIVVVGHVMLDIIKMEVAVLNVALEHIVPLEQVAVLVVQHDNILQLEQAAVVIVQTNQIQMPVTTHQMLQVITVVGHVMQAVVQQLILYHHALQLEHAHLVQIS